MSDYKELYLKLFRASEKAVNLLILAQQECEELYLSTSEDKLTVLNSHECEKDATAKQ